MGGKRMQEDRGSNCGCNNGGLFGNMLCGCGDSEILFFIIIFLLLLPQIRTLPFQNLLINSYDTHFHISISLIFIFSSR